MSFMLFRRISSLTLNAYLKRLENGMFIFHRKVSKASKKTDKDQKLSEQLEECLDLLKPKPKVNINYTPEELEEGAKRAKEYSRLKMKQHRYKN